jgi:hypothetical protein
LFGGGGAPRLPPLDGGSLLALLRLGVFLFPPCFVLGEVRCLLAIRAVELLSLRFSGGGCCPLTEDFTRVLVLGSGFLVCLRQSV